MGEDQKGQKWVINKHYGVKIIFRQGVPGVPGSPGSLGTKGPRVSNVYYYVSIYIYIYFYLQGEPGRDGKVGKQGQPGQTVCFIAIN